MSQPSSGWIARSTLVFLLAPPSHCLSTDQQVSDPREAPAMSEDLKRLTADLTADDEHVRAAAAEALCRQGEIAQPAAISLALSLADPSESVVEWSAAALEGIGSPDPCQLRELIGLLKHDSPEVGYWAATLIGRLEEQGAPAAESLANALSGDTATNVKQRAAWALGKIGPAAEPALPALRTAAATHDPRLARLAKRAIEQIRSG
jgi:HEAT repeat protein